MGKNDQGLKTGKQRYRAVPRVLIFLRNGSDVLLLKGAPTKRIWANKFNGVGGHVEGDESIKTAARREVEEETGLVVENLKLTAIINIDAGESNVGIIVFAFVGWCNRRETIPSNEGELFWIPLDQLSKYDLVEDLNWLLPRVMKMTPNQEPLDLFYYYDDQDKLVIKEMD